MKSIVQTGTRANHLTASVGDLLDRLEDLASADTAIICDISSSMAGQVSLGRSRWDVLVETLAVVHKDLDGKVIIVAFSDEARLVDGLEVPPPSGCTAMAAALKFTAKFTPEVTILLSDGEPTDDKNAVLAEARVYPGTLHCIFCGMEGSRGAHFLLKLAKAAGGTSQVHSFADHKGLLASMRKLLLLAAPKQSI